MRPNRPIAPYSAYLGGLRLRLTISIQSGGPNSPMAVSTRPCRRRRRLVARVSDPLSSTASARDPRPVTRRNRPRVPISAALDGFRLWLTISRYLCLPSPPMNVSTSLDGREGRPRCRSACVSPYTSRVVVVWGRYQGRVMCLGGPSNVVAPQNHRLSAGKCHFALRGALPRTPPGYCPGPESC